MIGPKSASVNVLTNMMSVHGGDLHCQPSMIVRLYSSLSPAGPPRSFAACRLIAFTDTSTLDNHPSKCFHCRHFVYDRVNLCIFYM